MPIKNKTPRGKLAAALYALCLTLTAAPLKADGTAICKVATSLQIHDKMGFRPQDLIFQDPRLVAISTNLTLFIEDASGRIQPSLAKQWEVDKPNRRITITMDKSCHWSDGAAITAQDMAEGIRLLLEKEIVVYGRKNIRYADDVMNKRLPKEKVGVRAYGDNVLEIQYTGTPEVLFQVLSLPQYTPFPTHLKSRDGFAWPKVGLADISSGPYKLQSQDSQKIVLTRNPYYCDLNAGNIQQVDVYTQMPLRAEVGALISERVDILFKYPFRSLHELKQRLSSQNENIVFEEEERYRAYYMLINERNPALSDSRVKKAISLAIDHELIQSNAILGRGTSLMKGYTPGYGGYKGPEYPRDNSSYSVRVEKAKALMHEAGYSKDRSLELDIPLPSGFTEGSATEALVGMLRNIYITPKVRRISNQKEFYANHFKGTYDIVLLTWADIVPDPGGTLGALLGLAILTENEVQQLRSRLEESYKVQNTEERYAMLNSIEERLIQSESVVPLYMFNTVLVFNKHLELGQTPRAGFIGMHNRKCET